MESKKAKGDISAPGLSAAIDRAKKDSMPKDNIDRAIAKGKSADSAALEETLYETFGPGGTALLITAVTDNSNRTTPEIRHLLNKAGYQLGAVGSAMWAFVKTESGYTPASPIELNDGDGEKLAALIEAIEEHDDVQEIYTTADSLITEHLT